MIKHNSKLKKPKICKICGDLFAINGNSCKRRYCEACRIKIKTKKSTITEKKYERKLPTGSLGTLSELLVAIDLINRGFYVFRSITPNSPCDLIAEKDGQIVKLEVRTGNRSKMYPAKIYYATPIPKYCNRIDSLVTVIPEESLVIYEPELGTIVKLPSVGQQ